MTGIDIPGGDGYWCLRGGHRLLRFVNGRGLLNSRYLGRAWFPFTVQPGVKTQSLQQPHGNLLLRIRQAICRLRDRRRMARPESPHGRPPTHREREVRAAPVGIARAAPDQPALHQLVDHVGETAALEPVSYT